MLTRILALLLAILAVQPAYAGSPFIWGSDSRAQGLQASGLFFSNRQTVDYNGQINYVGNQSAVDTTGWTAYADAAGTTPVDCTGGSPNSTWTTTTTTPQRGSSNFVWTHNSGASRQGEGVAYAFTTDRQDTANGPKTLSIRSDVYINDVDYTNGDLAFYIYDVTNAALITPSITSISGSPYTFVASFVPSTSTSYRLCIHTAGTGTGQWLANFDNFLVGPGDIVTGTPFTDWQAWTPTGSWVSNTTYTGTYMRAGSQLYGSVKVATSGAPTSAALTVNLTPLGVTINTTALTDTGAGLGSTLGSCEASDSGTSYKCNVKYSSTTAVALSFQNNASGTEANVTQAAPFTFGSSDYVDFKFSVPINEWAGSSAYIGVAYPEYAYNTSTSTTASDTTAFAYGPSGALIQNITASLSRRVRFLTPVQATDKIMIQISTDRVRWADLPAMANNGNSVEGTRFDGSDVFGIAVEVTNLASNSTDVDITFGNLRTGTKAWSTGTVGTTTYWRAVKIPGQVQVATNASAVSARAHNSATAISGSLATVVFTTEDFDSYSALTSGVFTVPVAGKYEVNVALAFSGTFALNTTSIIEIQKNGTAWTNGTFYAGGVITNSSPQLSDIVNAIPGDTIRVQASSSATGPAIVSSDTRNFLSIVRVSD